LLFFLLSVLQLLLFFEFFIFLFSVFDHIFCSFLFLMVHLFLTRLKVMKASQKLCEFSICFLYFVVVVCLCFFFLCHGVCVWVCAFSFWFWGILVSIFLLSQVVSPFFMSFGYWISIFLKDINILFLTSNFWRVLTLSPWNKNLLGQWW